MKKKLILAASVTVIAAGYILSQKYRLKQPEILLKEIQSQFNGVESSYILYTPERYRKFGLETEIYRGGLTTNFDNYKEEFEFIVDAYTGQLIDCVEVTHDASAV